MLHCSDCISGNRKEKYILARKLFKKKPVQVSALHSIEGQWYARL